MHMSHDCRQSPLKALLKKFGTCHKTHTMTTRYRNHDTVNVPALQDTTPLDLVPPDHTMPGWESESSDKYSEEPNTHHHLAELQDQFWQLQDWLTHLELAIYPPTHTEELTQLTDRLQHLSMTLQPHPIPKPKEEPIHTTVQVHMDTLHATERERQISQHLYSQDIPTFHGKDSSKLRGLAHRPRNCCWHLKREPHTSSWGQIPWPNPHCHLQGLPSREMLRTQGHPLTEALSCKHSYLHITFYGNTTEG